MNQMDFQESDIPGLTRKPTVPRRIPAFAGMTWLSLFFGVTGCYAENDEPQPQVEVALGFLITNCEPSSPSV